MTWSPDHPQGNETGKIRHLTVPYTMGRGLDIGAGAWRIWPHATTVDNYDENLPIDDPNTGRKWNPDVIDDATELSLFADESMDWVFSSHLLEHLKDTEAVLKVWWRKIKVGGHLILYLPHKLLYPNIGEPGANLDHKHDFMPEDIEKVMERVGSWDLVENQTRAKGTEYSFFQVYQKQHTQPPALIHERSYIAQQDITQPKLLLVRYGGIGDLLVLSSVLPKLKEQGYHITLNTVPQGEETLRNNPYIDRFFLQDKGMVPNEWLEDHWVALKKEYDEALNFSETLEGVLLKLPGRRDHALTDEARRMTCNVNYLEFTHAIAGVPFEPKPEFYSTDEEKQQAADFKERHKDAPMVVWCLGGSSIHKMYPHADTIACWLLERTDCKILFLGTEYEQHLEWQIVRQAAKHFLGIPQEESEKEKLSKLLAKLNEHFGRNRLLCSAGHPQWPLRRKLTFCAEAADVLVGPETGFMWAAAMREIPKVLMLSHSSPENIGKHWVNTTILEPVDCPCYPCHRMQYDWGFCTKATDEKGDVRDIALCSWNIAPQRVYDSITDWLKETRNGAND